MSNRARIRAGGFSIVEAPAVSARTRAAFSLVELLVVIGIIALLISMLFPVLRSARQTAERAKCASNLHQLGLALQMYTNNNHGWLPDWSGWHVYPDGSSPEDSPGLGWVEKMEPYLSPVSPVYNCPSFPAKFYNYFIEGEWDGINGHHSMKFSDVKMTSRFVISAECTQQQLYPPPYGTSGQTTDDCDRDDFGLPCLCFPGDAGGFLMHPGGNNVLFDDMHIESFTAFDPQRITFHPKQMMSWDQVRAAGPDGQAPQQ